MSADASVSVDGTVRQDMELQEIRADLSLAREVLRDKLENGRIRDPERDRVRCEIARALAYVANSELKAYETASLEELGEEVERLKAAENL